jgi:hypothetical protein
MHSTATDNQATSRLTLARLPTPAKVLTTCIIVTLGIGMLGALGQIIVHDIIPTFYSPSKPSAETGPDAGHETMQMDAAAMPPAGDRGDLFADLAVAEQKAPAPFYQHEQFVWTLKWTHIHLFGMSMIFIFLGAVTIWLDAGWKWRSWLVALPFVGVLIDILAMWLKAFISPAFFWLHVPGGGLFAIIFAYVSLRALYEMWIKPIQKSAHGHF